MKTLTVRGARTHNLANVDVDLPRERMVVITGPSGSGKSSLAFDTIYAEGQRRYVESLSTYARQFLERLPKPDVDILDGLSPAISIEQRTPTRSPRSTVGTVTEIHDYLRLLFARVGRAHCPQCGTPVEAQTVAQMVDRILAWPEGTRFAVLAPVVRGRKGQLDRLLARYRKEGFLRARIDGEDHDLEADPSLDRNRAHTVELYVDRLSIKDGVRQRLAEALELALSLADGRVRIAPREGEEMLLSERFACMRCGTSLPEITPRTFSFNSPEGACPTCAGLGQVRRFDPERIVPDPDRSIRAGAIAPWGRADTSLQRHMIDALTRATEVDVRVPWAHLSEEHRAVVMHGGDGRGAFEGVIPWLERRTDEYVRRKQEGGVDEERTFEMLEQELGRYAVWVECPSCEGARLRPEALAITVAGHDLRALTRMPVHQARAALGALELDPSGRAIAQRILDEIDHRLGFLMDVGLDYLTLGRAAATLSGGESQRIRLATQIGAALSGVLYVLDEPSIGLHPRDNDRLIRTLWALRDRGNTVLVVEHDAATIRAADHVLDMGPGAGREGGRVVAQGTPDAIARDDGSVTGAFLAGRRSISVPRRRRVATGEVTLAHARTHNLRDLTVRIPLGVLTCVTGVSGSGKSSLVVDTLLPALRRDRRPANGASGVPAASDPEAPPVELHGPEDDTARIDRIVEVDQGPIGRTPRSNPATYTGIFDAIRALFAGLPEARARGYGPGRFSFNVKGGRCESCRGAGVVRVEMHFLPDVLVTCEACGGRRYNRETLEVRFRGKSVADVLDMPVDEAAGFFQAIPKVRQVLATLRSVGLGYLELGRSATTLSGGEAQRIKLARELARRGRGHALYVLDEPTTGLHFVDVELLVQVLQDLVDAGQTVVVIEHHLDVIKTADHLIDLGPEGGEGGGRIVAEGTPEEVAAEPTSHTGRALRPLLPRLPDCV